MASTLLVLPPGHEAAHDPETGQHRGHRPALGQAHPGHALPRAAPESVVNSHYATTIGKNGTRIQTVEHLMAAAAGLGVDNLDVEVDGIEIPALDGSAKPFAALLAPAGRH